MSFLAYVILIMFAIVIFGVINEKILQLPVPIGMMVLALGVSVFTICMGNIGLVDTGHSIFTHVNNFNFDEFLTDGILCFMLFTGSSHVKINNLAKNAKAISLLSVLSTVVAVVIYGGLFYLINILFFLNFSFIECCLLGCILVPTDPIAATGLLNKLGISEDIMTIIEGESLFNDGIGVTCFIIVSNIIMESSNKNGFQIMIESVFGAALVALFISFLFFKLMEKVDSPIYHICISLLNVSLTYLVCEHLGFSGVIASVVCGLYFSTMLEKTQLLQKCSRGYYEDFWHILDALMNYTLYILIGFSFLHVKIIDVRILMLALIINIVSRAIGVALSTKLMGKTPDEMGVLKFSTLLTYGGLKGGLSLALMISSVAFLPKDTYDVFLSITYCTIVFTTIVQGLTVTNVYNLLMKLDINRFMEKFKLKTTE